MPDLSELMDAGVPPMIGETLPDAADLFGDSGAGLDDFAGPSLEDLMGISEELGDEVNPEAVTENGEGDI